MQIFGVSATNGSQAVSGVKVIGGAGPARAAGDVADVRDSVSLSVDGVRAAEAAATADIRFDRVQAIRAAIADGSYDTPEKLDIALDRLLDSIG